MIKKRYLIIAIILVLFVGLIILDSFLAVKYNRVPVIHNKNDNGILISRLRCGEEQKTVWKFDRKNCLINSKNQSVDNKDKILLELNHEIDWDNIYGLFGTEAETTEEDVNIVGIKLNETDLKQYNNEEELIFFRDLIYKKLNIKLDNKWKYSVNIWNDDDNVGNISFIYFIDENISTNKAINFFWDNGTIFKMSYSYLDAKIDEDSIINNVVRFKENTIQEKKILDADETFLEERTYFSYNYRINKTTYSYCLFFKEKPIEGENIELVNNDYGSEYFVEDFLKDNNLS